MARRSDERSISQCAWGSAGLAASAPLWNASRPACAGVTCTRLAAAPVHRVPVPPQGRRRRRRRRTFVTNTDVLFLRLACCAVQSPRAALACAPLAAAARTTRLAGRCCRQGTLGLEKADRPTAGAGASRSTGESGEVIL